jgi:drug/metabolite transporter (DMT)-like permease
MTKTEKPIISKHFKAVFIAVFVTFLWSTSWVFIKIGLQADLPPVTFAGLRYVLAFLCLVPFVLFNEGHRRNIRKISKTMWVQLVVLGFVLYTITMASQYIGLSYLPSATVSLLLNFSPLFVAIPSGLINKEKTSFSQWLGILLTLIGVIIYFLPLNIPFGQLFGLVIVMIGVLSNAVASLLGRKVNLESGLPPIIITTISMCIGGLILLIAGSTMQGFGKLEFSHWLIIIWLAVVNTSFAFTMWNKSLQTLTAVESSIINSLMLPQIAIITWIFLSESLNLRQIFGLGLVTIGIIIVQIKMRNNPPQKISPPA